MLSIIIGYWDYSPLSKIVGFLDIILRNNEALIQFITLSFSSVVNIA